MQRKMSNSDLHKFHNWDWPWPWTFNTTWSFKCWSLCQRFSNHNDQF